MKACAEDSKSFESMARVLVDHYSGIHLREGKSLGGRNANPGPAFRYTSRDSKSKGKPEGFSRRAYSAVDDGDEDDADSSSWQEESWDSCQLEAFPPGSYDDEDDPELLPFEEQEYKEFELSEPQAIALNSIEELDDTADAGHDIQPQLAAHATFGKAKGKGKCPHGRGKEKGKMVRSHLTQEQRRDKRKAFKAKSKCLRCGGAGHWAGDPECKFPNGNGNGSSKPRAHVAPIQGNDSEGLHVAGAAS